MTRPRSKNRRRFFSAAMVAALIVVFVSGCYKETEEDIIKEAALKQLCEDEGGRYLWNSFGYYCNFTTQED